MKLRIAFAGFRHAHILDLYRLASERDDLEVVAACEEHAPTRDELTANAAVTVTHASCDEMWDQAQFDILAIGDYYGRRGGLAIRGLESGKHVIVDKPLCADLGELGRIAELSAERGLAVGCMLTMRDGGNWIALKKIIADGRIGEVITIDFQGQHPLMWGRRPEWYFQPGKHGGTINDIAIHALDTIPWMTGRQIVEVVAARAWNARLAQAECFQDAAQLMLKLDNGGGVLGDVSYLVPDSFAYALKLYWRDPTPGRKGDE